MSPRKTAFRAGPLASLSAIVLMALAAVMVLADPTPAEAQAAKVESQTRPDFGLLLSPPPRSSRPYGHGRDHPWRWRDHHPDWRDDDWRDRDRDRRPWNDEVALVDCSSSGDSYEMQRAIHRLRPGGVLILRGGACTGWLDIDKSLTILGAADFDRDTFGRSGPVSLQAPAGLPCVTVAPGVRLEIRDVVLESSSGGDAACVVGYDAEIIMRRSGVRYSGEAPAIVVDGGLLDIRDSAISAQTYSAAVLGYGATVTADRVRVTEASIGFELTPGSGQTNSLSNVTMLAGQRAEGYRPRALGVLVRGAREPGRVNITGSVICGYDEGLSIDGAYAELTNSLICRSRKGAVLYSGDLTIQGSDIGAEDVGVAAGQGRARITDNRLFGVNRVFFIESAAWVEARNNWVYSHSVCQPSRRPREGRRERGRYDWHAPQGDGWSCAYDGGSRDFYDRGERLMGHEYREYAPQWDGYEQYNNGAAGWYDEYGTYHDGD